MDFEANDQKFLDKWKSKYIFTESIFKIIHFRAKIEL